ncbi:DUF2157 domain-containing protein [Mucilaginibacter phyllosphaerae]|uniref:DUF2157 domain-containing protein n=1 Tax=Mucilaginibacter phyllosphaerae TaxID=1812349 RepID=A0A4Y8ALH5_9SPHI|nr:DUF2157 domain-containing protein [Mucilaginibacter phyllosphaerae]MBB3967696.1 hypothetical protein [Mucilaginibacter phyllosphaerae]TEW69249.1 DUF2157 domain-containing protein [Mucilaginibacter phyllosphaerae]GGH03922.1 hypothetical protein GCM10007352_06830 [Mucilaginibacter phyllosphaerae]
MEPDIYSKLHTEGYLSDASFEKIRQKQSNHLFSVHWELKTLLSLGVMLLSGGLGILVYKNIDTIGHQVILAFIALICIGCFTYCFKNKLPFSRAKVKAPNTGFDYILLLGSISMVTFIGYLQYQYTVFGLNYGLATFIPMLFLFYIAYYFDHLGILSMAIAALALWMGISITPKTLLAYGTFNSRDIILTYVLFGAMLLAAAYLTKRFDIKKHFKFSYHHYGVHVTFIALLAGYFEFYNEALSVLWIVILLALAAYILWDAYQEKSFYFILLAILYSYFALACLLTRMLFATMREDSIYFLFMCFIGSAIGLIFLLININKNLKRDDHLQ